MTVQPPLPTIGVIADRFGQRIHRIRYIIESRQIQPVSHAGNARIFSDADVERIGIALDEIARAKEGQRA